MLRVRRALLIVVGTALALAVLEIAARLLAPEEAPPPRFVESTPTYYVRDDILGYAPAGAAHARAVRTHGADLMYSVTYTIGDDRLRISPPAPSRDPNACALFFGDSFTYGEGVGDEDAMPYVVGALTGYRVYNFGFHGYGPHQMLAALDRGIVSRVVRCSPRLVLYQALVDHAWRAAGYAPWDAHGPRYVLTKTGLVAAGHFDETRIDRLRLRTRALLRHSAAYRRWIAATVIDADVERFVAIVAGARQQVAAMFPSATFQTILWDPVADDAVLRKEIDGLRAAGIDPVRISDVLPDYRLRPQTYALSRYDNHPSPPTQRAIARYVVSRWLSR